MLSAEIIIEGDKEFLKACYTALEPETVFKTTRANYVMKLNSKLKISVRAEDATAFRAVLTTLTGLLSVIEKAWKTN
ncbi:MAG: KEOPS complex subunit Pcc1 [Candidatus Nanoarchaeia archaeon]